jgi:hypothetical protein
MTEPLARVRLGQSRVVVGRPGSESHVRHAHEQSGKHQSVLRQIYAVRAGRSQANFAMRAGQGALHCDQPNALLATSSFC